MALFAEWVRVCGRCGRRLSLAHPAWRCSCGGPLDLLGPCDAVVDLSRPPGSMWDYAASLPLEESRGSPRVSLGEAATALSPLPDGSWAKVETTLPTGSFKARGAAVTLSVAAAVGVDKVVADSSGNAGRAVAAYARQAGITAEVHVPKTLSPEVAEEIAGYGASLRLVPGDRAAATASALASVERGGGWYASHVWQACFHHGVKTLAFELESQLRHCGAGPAGTVVVPAGNGTLVLGLWLGYAELARAGAVGSPPAVVAVQAAACAPLLGRPGCAPTAARGVAVPNPGRAKQVRAAVLATGGALVSVTEDSIAQARQSLAELGLAVEPTGALAWAWLAHSVERQGSPSLAAPVVAVLTGR